MRTKKTTRVHSFEVRARYKSSVHHLARELESKLTELQNNGYNIISVIPTECEEYDYPDHFKSTLLTIIASIEVQVTESEEKGNQFPAIGFEPLSENITDDDLVDYMQNHGCGTFLIYMRYRYDYEEEWTYSTEVCYLEDFSTIIWLNDWDEGQQKVEFLGIAEIS